VPNLSIVSCFIVISFVNNVNIVSIVISVSVVRCAVIKYMYKKKIIKKKLKLLAFSQHSTFHLHLKTLINIQCGNKKNGDHTAEGMEK